MIEHSPSPSADRARPPVIPLPVALYVCDELIFELYDGGQPWRRFSIRWERLVPGQENESEPRIDPPMAPPAPQTGLQTRQD